MPTQKLSKAKQDKALAIVATWLGPYLGHDGPAPTGQDAAYRALGPELVRDWDWPTNGPTPTILLEGGVDDWAYSCSSNQKVIDAMDKIGVFAEPYASYALCLYVA